MMMSNISTNSGHTAQQPHCGVMDNEIADNWAKIASKRAVFLLIHSQICILNKCLALFCSVLVFLLSLTYLRAIQQSQTIDCNKIDWIK